MPTTEQLREWLDTYKRAWVTKDTPLMLSLFTKDASYIENVWTPPTTGVDDIRAYMEWGFASQNDIKMEYRIIATGEDVGVAHWSASFVWAGAGVRCELDGIFEIHFAPDGKCDRFQEWPLAQETYNGEVVHRMGHEDKWSDGRRSWFQRVASDEERSNDKH